jgi:hypothetical protein
MNSFFTYEKERIFRGQPEYWDCVMKKGYYEGTKFRVIIIRHDAKRIIGFKNGNSNWIELGYDNIFLKRRMN